MFALEAFFNPAQKERLRDAIPRRVSCRTYDAPLTAGDWAALSYAAARYQTPGARLILMRVEESLFTGTLLSTGRVTGCTAIAAVVASSAVTRSKVYAGILGEAFVLEAVSMGLVCCWMTGSYRRRQLEVPLRSGEAVLGLIALGHPAPGAGDPASRRRKPLERLCKGDPRTWPEELTRAAQAVQLAPSAMNMQPWEMRRDGSRFILDASDRAPLELGIALCHAEITLTTPHTWHYAAAWRDPAAWAELHTGYTAL
ncbi:MAG: nitroreductase family protein [Aristaeellaceae bacterium]